ncbi:hypothetical protein [Vagococcus fessus]|uniref:Uncharacterized protein n=1 Tax=Vagococcus fessus TaxID=120370 RepID=A0A430A5M3_9ENTE|nr:hypothetical protein [Vagococcus fessus]RSU02084.1 hypothetical protein CBF31_10000 [Vagococcus fessus]
MSCQLVAGTVILNTEDGNKKFLVKKESQTFDFVTTEMNGEITSLATILQELKLNALLDVNLIDLVELTNITIDDKKMPLFVFEMSEKYESHAETIQDDFSWESPKVMRDVLARFNISGVPLF